MKGWSRRRPLDLIRTFPMKASDYLDGWDVSEADAAESLGKTLLALVIYVLALAAMFGSILLIAAGMDVL